MKTLDSGLGARFFNAPDYPQIAAAGILKMLEMAAAGGSVIIRHLILPGCLESTRQVLCWFADNAAGRARLSLMSQYTPVRAAAGNGKPPDRYLNRREYETVVGWLSEFGIEDGFCQELVSGSDWLPDFDCPNPFSSKLSIPVWHWKGGFV